MTVALPLDAPLAVTMGDPAGIGPEIIVKLAAASPPRDWLVIGDETILRRAVAVTGVDVAIRAVEDVRDIDAAALSVLSVGPALSADLGFGRVDARAGAAANTYIERAIDLAMAGAIGAIVTAPLNKEALAAAGVRHPGHTEILAARSGATRVGMMLANDELRVMLVSIHVPLIEAIAAVTPEAERNAIRLARDACRIFGVERPRIAVAGLNPHAGENGLFGREDDAIIAPAVAAARAEGIDASGPWPGDTVFMRARAGDFDAVVAQYHDQGLIPIKYLGIDHGVNITVGLPFIRTSVDHGTAFDIAGTGKADPSSLAYALKTARAMVAGRAVPAAAA